MGGIKEGGESTHDIAYRRPRFIDLASLEKRGGARRVFVGSPSRDLFGESRVWLDGSKSTSRGMSG